MISSKAKRYLRSQAHELKPIFQIGKDGVGTKQVQSIELALKAHELIKIKLLNTCPQNTNEVAIEISRQTKADVVQIIGHTIVLYKASEKKVYRLP